MKLTNNEKGSTLIMVLLIVAVITIIGASLFAMNMSASKQFTKKEHQVQARHMAEMGVMHYQAAVEEKVRERNQAPVEEFYKGSGKNRTLDHEKMRQVHTEKLCKAINEISKPSYESDLHHAYDVDLKGGLVDCNTIQANTAELAFSIKSTGKVPNVEKANDTTSVIAAKVDVIPQGSEGLSPPGAGSEEGEGGNDGGSGTGEDDNEEYEHISSFPSGSFIKEKNIKFRGSSQIEGGTIEAQFKRNFEVDGSLTIGRLDNDNIKLFVGRDFKGFDSITIGGGWDSLYEIIIGRDFYQIGSLTLYRQKNHNSQVANNKFIVCGDAYLQSPPNFFGYEDLFLVQGTVYNYDGSQKSPNQYKPKKQNFDFGNYCPTSPENPTPNPSEGDDYKWEVKPDVNADYFPGK